MLVDVDFLTIHEHSKDLQCAQRDLDDYLPAAIIRLRQPALYDV